MLLTRWIPKAAWKLAYNQRHQADSCDVTVDLQGSA